MKKIEPVKGKNSLRISTDYYYYKPVSAFFRSFELDEYASANVSFEHPVMDMGCGDGTFAAMLQEKGILDSVDIAIDYSGNDLSKVKKNVECSVSQADARALPFKSDILKSVFANGVIAGVPPDVDLALKEVYRVLVEKGLFVLTVPTPRFSQNLVIPRMLRKVGALWLEKYYLTRVDRRLGRWRVLDEEIWVKKLQQANFHIEQVRYYFTPRQAFWYSLLFPRFFQVFAFLKMLRMRWVRQVTARILEKLLRPIYKKEQPLANVHRRDQVGMLLIVARKKSV